MTLNDYLSKEKFPLTSHEGCSLRNQMWADAMSWEIFNKRIRYHEEMPEKSLAMHAELAQKMPHQARLFAEFRAEQKAAKAMSTTQTLDHRELAPA